MRGPKSARGCRLVRDARLGDLACLDAPIIPPAKSSSKYPEVLESPSRRTRGWRGDLASSRGKKRGCGDDSFVSPPRPGCPCPGPAGPAQRAHGITPSPQARYRERVHERVEIGVASDVTVHESRVTRVQSASGRKVTSRTLRSIRPKRARRQSDASGDPTGARNSSCP